MEGEGKGEDERWLGWVEGGVGYNSDKTSNYLILNHLDAIRIHLISFSKCFSIFG